MQLMRDARASAARSFLATGSVTRVQGGRITCIPVEKNRVPQQQVLRLQRTGVRALTQHAQELGRAALAGEMPPLFHAATTNSSHPLAHDTIHDSGEPIPNKKQQLYLEFSRGNRSTAPHTHTHTQCRTFLQCHAEPRSCRPGQLTPEL